MSGFPCNPEWLVGLIIGLNSTSVKIVRKAQTYQFLRRKDHPEIRLGDWIHFSIIDSGAGIKIEVIPQKLAVEVKDNAVVWVKTQIVSNRMREQPYVDCVWSHHFEWVVDAKDLFSVPQIYCDTVYDAWITPNTDTKKVDQNGHYCVMATAAIVKLSGDQMPSLGTPWEVMQSSAVADSDLDLTHSLLKRDRTKFNDEMVYTGLALFYLKKPESPSTACWSKATGIVFCRAPHCLDVPLGKWLDYSVKKPSLKDTVLFTTKERISKDQTVRTRVVNNRVQICDSIVIPKDLTKRDCSAVSNVLGLVFLDRKRVLQRFSSGANLDSLVGKACSVWFQYDNFNRQITWKFYSFAEHLEVPSSAPSDNDGTERFADPAQH